MSSINRAMDLLHKKMITYYKSNFNQGSDVTDAAYLEQFLYKIKYLANGGQGANSLDNVYAQQVLDIMRLRFPQIKNWFRKISGTQFERQIAEFQLAVQEAVTGVSLDTTQVQSMVTGAVRTDIIDINPWALEIIKTAGMKVAGNYRKGSAFGNVSIKMDVAGLQGDLTTIPTSLNNELIEIYRILSQSSFTAKNYSSQKNYYGVFENLGLGKTRTSTILLNILPVLTPGSWTYYLKTIAFNQDNPYVMLHVQHMRQVFEFSGMGQSFNGAREKGVRFLIYNDPSSPVISVRAISSIVQQILNEKTLQGNPFDSSMKTLISRDLKHIYYGEHIRLK